MLSYQSPGARRSKSGPSLGWGPLWGGIPAWFLVGTERPPSLRQELHVLSFRPGSSVVKTRGPTYKLWFHIWWV